MNIGEKIKQRRTQLGWSQRDLAYKMGYTNNSTIVKIEQGKVDVSQTKIVQFSEVLGVSIAYLMDWEESDATKNTSSLDNEFSKILSTLSDEDKEWLLDVIKSVIDRRK